MRPTLAQVALEEMRVSLTQTCAKQPYHACLQQTKRLAFQRALAQWSRKFPKQGEKQAQRIQWLQKNAPAAYVYGFRILRYSFHRQQCSLILHVYLDHHALQRLMQRASALPQKSRTTPTPRAHPSTKKESTRR